MGGLSFLIYPWGFIVQGIALWHFVKRRPENYWLYIIIFGGVLGAGVYMIVEVIPDLGLLRGTFQGFGKRSRIKALEIQILDNPSAGNLEELAELKFEQGEYREAREALNRAIASRADSVHAFYLRAKSSLEMGEYAVAIPDLEYVVAKDLQKAETYFASAAQFSTTPDTLYNYANFLKLSGRNDESREWLQKLAAKKKTLPTYMRRAAKPWFKRGKALQKELAQ